MKNTIKDWIKKEATDVELIDIVNEVNSWDGSLEEYRFYYMDELDDIFCGVKPTELLSKLADDFDVKDEGFCDTSYGLKSCSLEDAADEIRNNADEIACAVDEAWENICPLDGLKEYIEQNN